MSAIGQPKRKAEIRPGVFGPGGKLTSKDHYEWMESLLKSKLKPGDPFNSKLVDDFFKKKKSVLPPPRHRLRISTSVAT